MLQRGRKSSASVILPSLDGSPAKLEPPPTLSGSERVIFEEIVAAVDSRHFRKSDQALLASYVRAIGFEADAARRFAENPTDTKLSMLWERSTKALMNLSMKLRLCPLARQHAMTAGRLPPVFGPKPWA
jgi:hypothetical protein